MTPDAPKVMDILATLQDWINAIPMDVSYSWDEIDDEILSKIRRLIALAPLFEELLKQAKRNGVVNYNDMALDNIIARIEEAKRD